jgi:diamine N-acetyltransferase
MNNHLSIRKATFTDIQSIKQLAEAIWEPTYASILSKEQIAYMFDVIYTEDALRKQMKEGQTFLLLYTQEVPIGFASYSLKDKTEKIYKLNKIYLLPDMQGKGYGQKLLKAVENEIKTKGAKKLDLNVNRFNNAKQFYEHCGYSIYLEEDIAIGPYWMNDYVMRKSL